MPDDADSIGELSRQLRTFADQMKERFDRLESSMVRVDVWKTTTDNQNARIKDLEDTSVRRERYDDNVENTEKHFKLLDRINESRVDADQKRRFAVGSALLAGFLALIVAVVEAIISTGAHP
jgi:hypothetical protein